MMHANPANTVRSSSMREPSRVVECVAILSNMGFCGYLTPNIQLQARKRVGYAHHHDAPWCGSEQPLSPSLAVSHTLRACRLQCTLGPGFGRSPGAPDA